LIIGNKLGWGGYCNVFEVKAFNLVDSEKNEMKVEQPIDGEVDDDCEGLDPQERADKFRHITPFDEDKTKNFMAKHYQRNGSARYALKKLRPDLPPLTGALG